MNCRFCGYVRLSRVVNDLVRWDGLLEVIFELMDPPIFLATKLN
jgi:hypothetical protein